MSEKMRKIMALVDGSEYGRSVCDLTAWFATRLSAEVDLVHVLGRRDVSDEATNLSGSIGLGARTALLEELAELDAHKAKFAQKRGRAILEDARDYMQEKGFDAVNIRLRKGELVETVQDAEQDINLVVIGKRGVGADFNSMHLGSNLERVVRSSSKPVLVASRAIGPVNRFLIAFDNGNSAWKAVDYTARLAEFTDIDCHIITASDNTGSHSAGLEKAAATLRDAGYSVTTEVLTGQPEVAIAKKVASGDYDLLVMGAYGHSRIRNLIIGSTTTEMIRSCQIPIMLFR